MQIIKAFTLQQVWHSYLILSILNNVIMQIDRGYKRMYALVTGGTSGIGYELAKLLAADGYHLIIVARDEVELLNVSQEIKDVYGVNVVIISKNLFDPQNALTLYSEIAARNIEVEILINNAGQGHYGEFVDTDIIRELDIINLNICSLVVLTKLCLQDMVNRGSGRILNLSSVASKTPGPWQAVYHGTKAFVQSFTEAIRSERIRCYDNSIVTWCYSN